MIAIRTVAVINEKRIRRSIQAYLDGEQNCNLKWILGVIGSDQSLTSQLLLTRFTQYANTQRYRDLQATLVGGAAEMSASQEQLRPIIRETCKQLKALLNSLGPTMILPHLQEVGGIEVLAEELPSDKLPQVKEELSGLISRLRATDAPDGQKIISPSRWERFLAGHWLDA